MELNLGWVYGNPYEIVIIPMALMAQNPLIWLINPRSVMV
jgi:hypothetical protein